MIKPVHLKKGDTVAIVSTSRGTLGEPWATHKVDIAKKRLEEDYGFNVLIMPNALKGIDYLYEHPEKRAEDLMEAFKNKEVKAIFNAIGGDDAIRLLPYIDFDVIRNNPKIFTGFSDSTSIHLMLNKAGLCSYYGASVMNNFSEYVKINDYTKNMIDKTLINPVDNLSIESSSYYYDDEDEKIWWKEENISVLKKYHKEEIGYEVIQGKGKVEGELLGGCIDVFVEIIGTSIWPNLDRWKDKIMFLETSEEDVSKDHLIWILRNLAAQGIFGVVKGIMVGKPSKRNKYEPYKEAYLQVIAGECKLKDLPIICNVNFGHAEPIGVIPYGIKCQIDADKKTITLLEPATDK